MLGNKKSGFSVSGATTLISQDTVVEGDIRFSGSLDIEGLVRGNIIAEPGKDALLRLVGKGRVEGDIRVPSVIINGEVQGDVHSSKQVELAANARVQGNVFYNLVEMAAGSEVNGSLKHVGEGPVGGEDGPDEAGAAAALTPDSKVD